MGGIVYIINRSGEAGNGCETVAGCGAVVYSEVWGEYFVGACGACGVFRYGFVFSVCYVLFYVVEVYAVDGAVVPEGIRGVLEAWIREAYHQSSGTILSITVITTLWSGSKGFMGITYGLDKIYQVKNQRNRVVNRMSSH